MLKPRHSLSFLAAFVTLTLGSFADTVILKSGEKIEGRVLSETDTDVVVEIAVTSSIKDERVLKKADIAKIEKPQPDLEAWGFVKNLTIGDESLELSDYQRSIAQLSSFTTQFPLSVHVIEAKKRLAQFQEEAKRVEAGEMKLGGKWLSADEVKTERVQILGRVLFNRMKRFQAAGQLIEAMNTFDALEKSAAGSSSYADAVSLARTIVPVIKTAAEQGKVQLKAQADERKRRLGNVQGAERTQLEAMQKQQLAQVDAAVAAYEKSGMKWLPLSPANDRSLATLSSKAASEVTSLGRHNVPKMKESVAATERARTALASNDVPGAEKALQEASAAWSQNEMISRLQPKLADARTKAAAEAAAKAKADAEAAASAPKATPKATPAPASTEPAPVAEAVQEEEGSLLTKPLFWIVLFLIIGGAALGMKFVAKKRNEGQNELDQ